MNLGILTLPLWNNYGGIIQAYALQQTLKKLGHRVELLDYHHDLSQLDLFKNNLKRFIKYKVLNKVDNAYYPNVKENEFISKNTLNFIKKEFDFKSNKLYNKNDLNNATKSLDGVIVGSDQVWRPNYTPNIYNYFLDFLDKGKLKIAYAASLGTDKWLFNENEHLKCKELIHKFNGVSVREDSAIEILKDKFDYQSIQVLDPTMLLDKEDYINLIIKYSTDIIRDDNNSKIFTYILDNNPLTNDIVNKVNSYLDRNNFVVMPKKFDKNFSVNNPAYIFPPLTDWLRAFNETEFIIADSFHGCVFAIIFNKPFIAIGNIERGLTRFNSLLKLFNLEDRLILSKDDFSEDLVNKKINWEEVNEIRNKLKLNSIKFLKSSLNND